MGVRAVDGCTVENLPITFDSLKTASSLVLTRSLTGNIVTHILFVMYYTLYSYI